jgi:serine-type D-Ala-D-Ala carboxypeptidase/endopeptidase
LPAGASPGASVQLGRRALILATLVGPAVGARAQAGAGAEAQAGAGSDAQAGAASYVPPSNAVIRAILAERIDVGRLSVGLIGGLRTPDGRRLATYGSADTPANQRPASDTPASGAPVGQRPASDTSASGVPVGRPLDGDTVFEIGSITKVFTALLLADMVERGEVALDDPVAKYLPTAMPAGVSLATHNGKPITLLDLATCTSGLPNMPDNFAPRDQANPYADYTVAQLYVFLNGFVPRFDPGTHYEYSNLGFALLGHALALRAGRSYEDLVIERICAPLGMDSTRITLSPSMRGRLAQGHDSGLDPVPNWDLPTMAGAGALRSTANDLFTFLEVCLGLHETRLAPAFARMLTVRRHAGAQMDVAFGWFVASRHDDEIVWKSGETGGYSSFIGYSTKSRLASIVLSNANNLNSDLGFHLINPAYPLAKLHRQVAIDPARLATYVGSYAITTDFFLTITQRDGRLFVTATDQATYELFPESETDFFLRVVDAQITFERSTDGHRPAPALVLHQNGRDRRGGRLRLP